MFLRFFGVLGPLGSALRQNSGAVQVPTTTDVILKRVRAILTVELWLGSPIENNCSSKSNRYHSFGYLFCLNI